MYIALVFRWLTKLVIQFNKSYFLIKANIRHSLEDFLNILLQHQVK